MGDDGPDDTGATTRPDWLQWDGFEPLERAHRHACELVDTGDVEAGRDALRAVFERAVVAPSLPDGWLSALAGDLERVLGSSRDAVAEAFAVLRRAEAAQAPMDERARERALLLRARFIVDAADLDGLGAAALVLLAEASDDTTARFADLGSDAARADLIRIERVRLDIGIRVREHSTRDDVYRAFDRVLDAQSGDEGRDVALTRVLICLDAADFALAQDDTATALARLDTAAGIAIAADLSAAMALHIAARRVDVLLDAEVALDEVVSATESVAAETADDVMTVARIADHVGAALRTAGRDEDAHRLEERMLSQLVGSTDVSVRAAAARSLRWLATAGADERDFTPRERDGLRRAVAVFESDPAPEVRAETDRTLLRWATAEIHLGQHRAGLDALERLWPRVQPRVNAGDAQARWLVARARLVSHFGHAGAGDTAAALRDLAAVAQMTAADDTAQDARTTRAEAFYWRARLLHERGDRAGAAAVRAALLSEFSRDEHDASRTWASASLLSLWVAERDGDRAARADALARHAELFAQDPSAAIRAREVRRASAQAHDLRAAGDIAGARTLLDAAIERERGTVEGEIADAVARATDQRALLDVLDGDAARGPHRSFRGPSMADVDAIGAEGSRLVAIDPGAACAAFSRAAELAAGAEDPYARLAGVVALDNLTSTLLSICDVPSLLRDAERMVRACDDILTLEIPDLVARRVHGERALGLVRWATGLSKIGDTDRARHLYDLVADAERPEQITDDEHITAVSQAMYNRAVLLDERGDAPAAAAAYDLMIAAHRSWPDSAPRRLRLVKAHRNRAESLATLGYTADAALGHRAAVDLARGGPGEDLRTRLADSLGRFAELGVGAGLANHVLAWLDWALGGGVRLDDGERRRLERLRGDAARQIRRGR